LKATLGNGVLRLESPNDTARFRWTARDDGEDKLLIGCFGTAVSKAIYKRESGSVVICFGLKEDVRPTSFHADNQILLTLRRIKPGK
jgi:hypothetical protein